MRPERSTPKQREQIRTLANEVFRDAHRMHNWMNAKNVELGRQTPKDTMRTSEGAEKVSALLQKIRFGS